MQDDLISRSDLLKEFDPNGELLDPMAVRMKIVTAPTAYDVEKVVAELEENGQKMSEAKAIRPYAKHCPSDHRYYKAISVKKAVAIVRNGGKE